ncbi:hypothetical protein [Streptomyces hygroscopicus]|uniref:hypothetical protein n=1 Tax=Streptomyces hygroscopicus TaxID=1912 RepID=UPI0007DB4BC2
MRHLLRRAGSGARPADPDPVTATLFSRSIALRFADDADAMGWAPTDNGSPGDEVRLGRSCDGGRAWSSGEPPR